MHFLNLNLKQFIEERMKEFKIIQIIIIIYCNILFKEQYSKNKKKTKKIKINKNHYPSLISHSSLHSSFSINEGNQDIFLSSNCSITKELIAFVS